MTPGDSAQPDDAHPDAVDWDLELAAEVRADAAFEQLLGLAGTSDPADLIARARAESVGETVAADSRRVQRYEEWFQLEAGEQDGEGDTDE